MSSNNYNSEFPSIYDVVSRKMDNLVVLYSDSTDHQYKALAFQINQAVRRSEYISNLPSISDGGYLDFGYFGEQGHSGDTNVGVGGAGNDKLRVAYRVDEVIEEWGLAVQPDDFMLGVANPSGSNIIGVESGNDPDRARGWSADPSQPNNVGVRGSVRSQWTRTPSGIPTTAASTDPSTQGLIRWDSDPDGDNELYTAYQNLSNTTQTPTVVAMGMRYHVVNVQDEQKVRRMLNGDISRRVVQYGGFDNYSPNIPPSWKGNEVTVDEQQVRGAIQ